jgi:uncharacterized protein
MRLLEPWLRAERLPLIDLYMLKAHNINALLIDMDNTLVPWHTFFIDKATNEWLEKAKVLDFKICIISNNKKWRILKIIEMIEVKGVWGASKPFPGGYCKALKELNARKGESVFVGDQIFTDIVGANVLGLKTILVNPISPHEYKWTRFMRRLERIIAGRSLNRKAE